MGSLETSTLDIKTHDLFKCHVKDGLEGVKSERKRKARKKHKVCLLKKLIEATHQPEGPVGLGKYESSAVIGNYQDTNVYEQTRVLETKLKTK